ncbi:MAG TPA: hypothetical protein VLC92_05505 [Rhodocyclaceae bacterium]|nr:hypothetical protein [Rhodocyclaceae bacterium]
MFTRSRQAALIVPVLDVALLEELATTLLEEDELDFEEELLLGVLLEATLEATLDATLELALLDEDELVAAGPTEHHALVVKLFDGNNDCVQVKLPVSVA